MKKLIPFILILSGCSISPLGKTTAGGAIYSYERTKEGCAINVNSSRSVSGADIHIGQGCEFSIHSDKAGIDERYINIIDTLSGAIK